MGLTDWNVDLRSEDYPRAVEESWETAFIFGKSEFVEGQYRNAEALAKAAEGGKALNRLPSWAMTWPAGQMGAIGRTGRFASNIRRYEQVFDRSFGTKTTMGQKKHSILTHVHIVPLEDQTTAHRLRQTLRPVLAKLAEATARRRSGGRTSDLALVEDLLERALDAYLRDLVGNDGDDCGDGDDDDGDAAFHRPLAKRNANDANDDDATTTTMAAASKKESWRKKEMQTLVEHFEEDTRCLEGMLGGRRLGWSSSPS